MLLQAQDTPFSYQIKGLLDDEEVTLAAVALGNIPDGVKAKLQDMLKLLNQDVGLLVQDAEGIWQILNRMQGQLPADIEAALLPSAFIEVHRLDVFQAQQRLSDRAAQAELIQKRESSRSRENNMKLE